MNTAELMLLIRAKDEASAVLKSLEGNTRGLASSIERYTRPAYLALAAAATIVSGATFLAARAAIEEQSATAALAAAVNATGQAFAGANEAGVMAFVRSLENFSGYSRVEVMNSLQLLTEQTGDVEEAMKRELIAVDFARGAHLDLWAASKLLGKVTDETINVLARYGIHVEKGTTATELFAIVQQKFAGQAGAFAGTVEGKWEKLKNRVHDLEAEIGAALLPTFQKLLDAADAFIVNDLPKIIQGVQDFTAKNPDVLAFGLAILGVVAALAAVGVIVGPIAAALGLILSPIGLIVLALVGLKIAWEKNFLGIQQIVKDFALGVFKAADDIGGFFDGMGTAVHKVLDEIGAAMGQWVRERLVDITRVILKLREAAGLPLPSSPGPQTEHGGSQDNTGPAHPAAGKSASLDDIYAAYERVTGGKQISIDYAREIQKQGFSYSDVANKNVFAGDVIPSFDRGGTMPYDGLAYLHAGETVSRGGRGGGDVIVPIYGDVYGVDDLKAQIRGAVREAIQGGGFRGVLGVRR